MPQSSLTFSGINSNAEQYFGGATATSSAGSGAITDVSLSNAYVYKVPPTANNLAPPSLPSTGVFTHSQVNMLKEKRAADPTSSIVGYDMTEADYGWVDPFFIKFLAQNYSEQYPGISTCLPGGPSIDPGRRSAELVSTPTLALALTTTSSVTSYASGCFNTDSPVCATAPPAPAPTLASEVAPTPSPPPPPPPKLSQSVCW